MSSRHSQRKYPQSLRNDAYKMIERSPSSLYIPLPPLPKTAPIWMGSNLIWFAALISLILGANYHEIINLNIIINKLRGKSNEMFYQCDYAQNLRSQKCTEGHVIFRNDVNVTSIHERKYFEKRITQVDISNLPKLAIFEKSAFAKNYKLSSIKFGAESILERIEESAFESCDIEQLRLPSSLKYLGPKAFHNNSRLRINDICIEGEESLRYDNLIISSDAFDFSFRNDDLKKCLCDITDKSDPSCRGGSVIVMENSNLKIIDDNHNLGGIKNRSNKDKRITSSRERASISLLDLSGLVNVEIISDSAFESSQINQVIFPGKITHIGIKSFADNSIHSINWSNLSTLIKISEEAFKNNTITSVELPNSLKHLGSSSFYGNKLSSLEIPWSSKCHEPINQLIQSELKTIPSQSFGNNNLKYLVLQNARNLDSIHKEAFSENPNIEEICLKNLPKLTRINSKTFSYDTLKNRSAASEKLLKSVVISNLTQLEEIEHEAFAGNSITSLNFDLLPKLKVFGDKAFEGNELEYIDLSGITKLKKLGKGAFMDNENVKAIFLGSSIEMIAESAFEGSVSNLIQKLKIPSSVISIGKHAFKGMSKDFFENHLCWDMSGTEIPKVHKDAFSPHSYNDKLRNKCI